MQSTNYTSVHFLRGRQTTDASGLVTFTSIFPGWYSGRAPHIHVHVYSASGTSLLVTQIAFPTDVCDTIYTTASPYSSRGKQDTSNTTDNVFSDSLASELASITGTVAAGYTLTKGSNCWCLMAVGYRRSAIGYRQIKLLIAFLLIAGS